MCMSNVLAFFFPSLRGLLDSLTPPIQHSHTLQKQVGYFSHRVVALVADKLERQWSLEVCFDVED